MVSPYRRSLPSHPDLAQLKKQAKDLLRDFSAGDADALARMRGELPDKPRLTLADAQFVLAREYGFPGWPALRQHVDAVAGDARSPVERMHEAFQRRDAREVRRLMERHPEFRERLNDPVFPFDSPALVALAKDAEMVEALLELGADPDRRSGWWAGGFHPLHVATGAAAEHLLAAGATPDACAAAHLDRLDLLERMLAGDHGRVHERGGDGQTPLHFARSRAAVDLLLAWGAEIDARDVDHRSTPAEWMLERRKGAGRYHLARYLVDRGASADIFLAAALGLTDRVQAMLRERPELLEARTGRGDYGEHPPASYHIYFWTIGDARSPLDVAAQFEQPETLELLWQAAPPLQRLLSACRQGDEARARSVLRSEPGLVAGMKPADHRAISDAAWNGDGRAVALMLELGFDPATPGHDSGNALHCAAWQGSSDTVAVLLRHPKGRALVPVRDARYGATPLGWCTHGSRFGDPASDHVGVARLLLQAGARTGPDTALASPPVAAVLGKSAG